MINTIPQQVSIEIIKETIADQALEIVLLRKQIQALQQQLVNAQNESSGKEKK